MSFIDDIVKATGNDLVSEYSDTPTNSYLDTGSYVMNALLSGSIYGGAAYNRVTAFIGEPATGKSFFTLAVAKNFLDTHANGCVLYYESEGALDPREEYTQKLLKKLGIDLNRFRILPVQTVQEFRTQALKSLEAYTNIPEEDRPKLMICLDSLGNLSTSKEMEDSTEGKETNDMTRARLVKGVFRVLTLKLTQAKVPMFVTNHTYTQIGVMFPQQIPGGGSGLIYAASAIVALSRRKEKDGDEVVGNIIHCKNFKNRLAKENKIVDVKLTYEKGINKYYGLVELALAAGIFKQSDKRIELPDGSKKFVKTVNDNPEEVFTKEVLDLIDEYVRKEFTYGANETKPEVKEEE